MNVQIPMDFKEELHRRYREKANSLIPYLKGKIDIEQFDVYLGITTKVMLNEGRSDREKSKFQSFADSNKNFKINVSRRITLEDELETTVMFDKNLFPNYYIAANPAPIKYGFLVLIRDTEEGRTVNDEVDMESLETMVRFAEASGASVYHNMGGVGATKMEAHWQASLCEPFFFVKTFEKSRLHNCGLYTMKDYPGENFVFRGKDKVKNAFKLINYLNRRRFKEKIVRPSEIRPRLSENDNQTPYSVLIVNDKVYAIPVKNEQSPLDFGLEAKSRIAGCELGTMTYVALSRESFEKFAEKDGKPAEILVKDIIANALFKKGELVDEVLDLFSRVSES